MRTTFAILFILAFASPAFAQDSAKKAPVPNEAAQADATKSIKEVYGDEWAAAKTPAQKQALANKLLGKANESKDDPASQFVLLRLARDIATQADDKQAAFKAIDAMNELFQIDAEEMKLAILTKFAATVQKPGQHKAIAEEALKLATQAVRQDNFTVADQLDKLAVDEAQRANEKELGAEAEASVAEVAQITKAYEAVKAAKITLGKTPDDSEANLVVGKYVCFVKGDWDMGVSMLALGKDEGLKALAKQELAGVASATEQTKLGDGWWNLADKQEGIAKKGIQDHAAYWYQKALPGLSGIIKDKDEKRVMELMGKRRVMPNLDAEPTTPVNKVTVIKAVFGISGKPSQQLDVTSILQKAVANDPFTVIQVDPSALGDPANGRVKRLVLQCRSGNNRFALTLSEGEVASIPPIPPKGIRFANASQTFTILAARFGAALTWVDVTERVKSLVDDPNKAVKFEDFRVDPLVGVHKNVAIWFDYRGTRYVRIFMDGETHSLLP